MKKKYLIGFLGLLLIGCKTILKSNSKDSLTPEQKKELDSKTWYQKDYLLDGVPGISIDKWYKENKKQPKNDIIVAVLDTQLDINHEDLQGQLWTNTKEIPNNKIDDDNNGYIDDANGWNFLGTKSGNYVVWTLNSYTRYVKEMQPLFMDKTESQIDSKDLLKYKIYKKALDFNSQSEKYLSNWLKSLNFDAKVYPKVKETLKQYFPKEDYTYNQLDSLYKIKKINDKTYIKMRDDNDMDDGALIYYMMANMETETIDLNSIIERKEKLDSVVNKSLNVNYNERKLIGDNPNILEKGYGNNIVCSQVIGIRKLQDHCTKVSGIIAANRENNIGQKGFSNNIKIMPLSISCSGDENDKDIAMAIYYAVDNGAKIINMSIGKEFSVHKEWVFDAYKYAEEHNVLVIHSAGNNKFDNDINPYFPNDIDFEGGKEVCNNFINVGSISQKLDSTFVSKFSNYGNKNIDLFAPGSDIYTTIPENKYDFDSGTSLAAPMISGTAALIWLYYPNLTVQEVKQIILESGTSYDLEVLIPGGEGKKTKFSELSKSGKVLNVYNAMKMAKEMSRKKKE